MLRETLTATLADYEAKHPVSEWRMGDVRVWPAIRNGLTLSLHQRGATPAAATAGAGRLAGVLRRQRQRLSRWVARQRNPRGPNDCVDALFLSNTNRGERFGNGVVNTVVDPWVEEVHRTGRRAAVWDLGDRRRGQGRSHVSVQHAIDEALRGVSRTTPSAAPDWFRELSAFAHDALDVDLGWDELGRELASIEALAQLFGGWLEGARPRVVVLDCWYAREGMALALAAHRLGIPSVDLQHGIQGRAHPAYAGWSPGAIDRYALMPDAFWVWGPWDADSLLRSNPGAIPPERVRVVGHRWLHAWADAKTSTHRTVLRQLRRGLDGAHTICVTLQKGVPFRETLIPLAKQAPAEWRWLVRLHRSMHDDPRELEQELRAAAGPNIDVVAATRLPLHAVLAVSDWHVTGFSTCALEALAFGVPTLLTHESGEHAFREFIEAGAMAPWPGLEPALEQLATRSPEQAAICQEQGARVFAAPVSGGPWSSEGDVDR